MNMQDSPPYNPRAPSSLLITDCILGKKIYYPARDHNGKYELVYASASSDLWVASSPKNILNPVEKIDEIFSEILEYGYVKGKLKRAEVIADIRFFRFRVFEGTRSEPVTIGQLVDDGHVFTTNHRDYYGKFGIEELAEQAAEIGPEQQTIYRVTEEGNLKIALSPLRNIRWPRRREIVDEFEPGLVPKTI